MGADRWFAREDFAALYPRLRRFAAVVGSLELEPDDLVQDALAAMLRRAHTPDSPEAFLRRSIVNLAISGARHRRRWQTRLPLLASGRDAHVDEYPSDLRSLERIPARSRAIVWLVDIEGWSSADVAGLLEMREPAVRQQLSRGRKRLRLELASEEDR